MLRVRQEEGGHASEGVFLMRAAAGNGLVCARAEVGSREQERGGCGDIFNGHRIAHDTCADIVKAQK